jgi:hypothetical protein
VTPRSLAGDRASSQAGRVKPRILLQAVPLALAAAALLHGFFPDGLASEGGVGLSNVSGRAGDCVAPTRHAACAPLFDGSELLFPGGAPVAREVDVTWHGGHATSLGLYVDNFSSRDARSQPACTAADPADRLDLAVSQDGTLLYEGTLARFARDHGTAAGALDAHGDSGRFRIAVALDRAAGNSYMGCVSTAGLVWIASQ